MSSVRLWNKSARALTFFCQSSKDNSNEIPTWQLSQPSKSFRINVTPWILTTVWKHETLLKISILITIMLRCYCNPFTHENITSHKLWRTWLFSWLTQMKEKKVKLSENKHLQIAPPHLSPDWTRSDPNKDHTSYSTKRPIPDVYCKFRVTNCNQSSPEWCSHVVSHFQFQQLLCHSFSALPS